MKILSNLSRSHVNSLGQWRQAREYDLLASGQARYQRKNNLLTGKDEENRKKERKKEGRKKDKKKKKGGEYADRLTFLCEAMHFNSPRRDLRVSLIFFCYFAGPCLVFVFTGDAGTVTYAWGKIFVWCMLFARLLKQISSSGNIVVTVIIPNYTVVVSE